MFCAVAGLTAPDIGDLIAGVLIPRLPHGSLLTVLALIGTTSSSPTTCSGGARPAPRWNAGPTPAATTRIFGKAAEIRCSRWSSACLITAEVGRRRLTAPRDRERTRRTWHAVAERLEPLLGRAAPVLVRPRALARRADLGDHRFARPPPTRRADGARVAAGPFGSGRFHLLWGFVLANGLFCADRAEVARRTTSSCWRRRETAVLPLTLILLLMVANKTRIMGTHSNSRLTNVLGVTRSCW